MSLLVKSITHVSEVCVCWTGPVRGSNKCTGPVGGVQYVGVGPPAHRILGGRGWHTALPPVVLGSVARHTSVSIFGSNCLRGPPLSAFLAGGLSPRFLDSFPWFSEIDFSTIVAQETRQRPPRGHIQPMQYYGDCHCRLWS